MNQRRPWHAGSLHWALIGEVAPSCMQHGQALLQRPGVPGGMPAPAGQLPPLPSSAHCVQGAQSGSAAGGPLYAQAFSHQAAPPALQLPQHSTGVAELQAAPPAHVHSVMRSSQTDPAAQQPAPALYQGNAGVMVLPTAAASNSMAGAVPSSQAHGWRLPCAAVGPAGVPGQPRGGVGRPLGGHHPHGPQGGRSRCAVRL